MLRTFLTACAVLALVGCGGSVRRILHPSDGGPPGVVRHASWDLDDDLSPWSFVDRTVGRHRNTWWEGPPGDSPNPMHKWEYDVPNDPTLNWEPAVYAPPLLADNVIYTLTDPGYLYATDAVTGQGLTGWPKPPPLRQGSVTNLHAYGTPAIGPVGVIFTTETYCLTEDNESHYYLDLVCRDSDGSVEWCQHIVDTPSEDPYTRFTCPRCLYDWAGFVEEWQGSWDAYVYLAFVSPVTTDDITAGDVCFACVGANDLNMPTHAVLFNTDVGCESELGPEDFVLGGAYWDDVLHMCAYLGVVNVDGDVGSKIFMIDTMDFDPPGGAGNIITSYEIPGVNVGVVALDQDIPQQGQSSLYCLTDTEPPEIMCFDMDLTSYWSWTFTGYESMSRPAIERAPYERRGHLYFQLYSDESTWKMVGFRPYPEGRNPPQPRGIFWLTDAMLPDQGVQITYGGHWPAPVVFYNVLSQKEFIYAADSAYVYGFSHTASNFPSSYDWRRLMPVLGDSDPNWVAGPVICSDGTLVVAATAIVDAAAQSYLWGITRTQEP